MSTPTGDAPVRSVRDKYRNAPTLPVFPPAESAPEIVDVPHLDAGPSASSSTAAAQENPADRHPSPQLQTVFGKRGPHRPTADLDDAKRSARINGKVEGAKRGWRATLNRRLGMSLAKGADELAYDRHIAQIQRPLRESKKIAVLSGKGAAGKTSISLSMGATLASKRTGAKVVALSIDPLGNITDRVRTTNDQAPASVMALAAESDAELKRIQVVDTYLLTDKSSGLRVLGASTADGAPFLTPSGLSRVLGALQDMYLLTIVDFGLNIDSPAYHEGLACADQLVLAAATSADSIDELHTLIATLKLFGGKYLDLLSSAVVVFSQTSLGKSHIDVNAERTRITNAYSMPVVTIPWNEHMSEGGPMSLDLMSENTRLPYVWLASEVMSRLSVD